MKVAIMGYGTIGSGVAQVLKENKDVITKRVGQPVELKYILDLREFPGDENEDKIVNDYKTIVDDKDVDIVVETMGGVEPAYTFVKAMLESGKSVTTSNKALVADKGADLIATAKANNVTFLFEAAVGGGIPVIRTITEALTGDVITEIQGIMNGTTNYMLTKMSQEGSDFDDVLKDAQAKGYAEKDPTADIEGYDACRKIAILTSLACNQQVNYEDVPTEGITKISATDIVYAKKMNRAIKLIGHSVKINDTYAVRVAPFLVPEDSLIYHVNDVFNAVMLRGNMLGESMYYGAGAGSLPTASAVVGDVVELAKNVGKNIPLEWKAEPLKLADPGTEEYSYFVRTKAPDAVVERVFGKVKFIDAGDDSDEIGFVTEVMSENEFEQRKVALSSIVSVIRLL